jgi:photosystem II stability/assembly factor-like uncharacterized protein
VNKKPALSAETTRIIFRTIAMMIFVSLLGTTRDTIDSRRKYEIFLTGHLKNCPEYPHSGPEEYVEMDHPEFAAFQDYIMTVDPATGTVPSYRLLDAFHEMKELKGKSDLSDNFFEWQEVFANVGGRTRTIVFDPNDPNGKKAWAGAVTGGLWYNNDAFSEIYPWVPVDDFWDNLIVSSIVYDPQDPQVMYVGTGEPQTAVTIYRESSGVGVGIWKTADGGTSWNLLNSTTDFSYVTDMVMRVEENKSVLYAAVVSGLYKGDYHLSKPSDGLYRSDDGGSSWEQVLPDIPGTHTPYAPSDLDLGADERLFVGTMRTIEGKGAATILYSDDGVSWNVFDDYHTEISNTTMPLSNIPGRVILAASPSDSSIIYAVIGSGAFDDAGFLRTKAYAIIRSEDRGVTWTKTNMPYAENRNWAYLAWHALMLDIDPNDPDVLYAGGLDMYKTMDGGQNWYQISDWRGMYGSDIDFPYVHGDFHKITFQPGSSDFFLIGTDGGIFMTKTGSDSLPQFQERNLNYNTIQYYTCAIHPEAGKHYFLAGTQDNGTFRYLEQPITVSNLVSGGDGAYCFFDEDDPNINITSVYYNRYYIFYNGTENILNEPNLIYDYISGIFINPADYDDANNTIYANATTYYGELQGHILRITGVTDLFPEGEFIDLKTGTLTHFSSVKISPHSTTERITLFVGTAAGDLFRVNNAQDKPDVDNITGIGFPNGNISCIDVGENPEKLIVTFSNFGVKSVWITTDGGSSWQDIEGNLPDMPVRWVMFHPLDDNKAILATELGIWSTFNLNGNPVEWKPDNEGLANVRVDMLRLRESDMSVLAATHGRGLFLHNNLTLESKPQFKDLSEEVSVYPNPTDGLVHIKTSINGEMHLELYDLSARMVQYQVIKYTDNQGMVTLNLSDLPAGSYILSGSSKSGQFRKIIILQ